MKRMSIIVVLALMVLAVGASLAQAAYVDSSNADPTTALHAGYGAATNACQACHDVHGGDQSTDAPLWRWATKQAGCEFCHLGAGAASGTEVYNLLAGVQAEHTIGGPVTIPDTVAGDTLSLGLVNTDLDCFDCHDGGVHGHDAGAWGSLITDYSDNWALYCGGGCHSGNDDVDNGGGGDSTHPIAAATGVTAFVATNVDECRDCHITIAADGFPHQSTEWMFLGVDGDPDALDAVCLGCHDDGAGSGVGQTY